jgi:hypothetical protein
VIFLFLPGAHDEYVATAEPGVEAENPRGSRLSLRVIAAAPGISAADGYQSGVGGENLSEDERGDFLSILD